MHLVPSERECWDPGARDGLRDARYPHCRGRTEPQVGSYRCTHVRARRHPRTCSPCDLESSGERRRSARLPLRLAVEVYDASHHLGRFWTHDVSQEGMFLKLDRTDLLRRTILRLGFDAQGVTCFLRGAPVREIRGEGVGIQLAFWRHGDEAAHAAYRELIAAPHFAPLSRGQASASPNVPERAFAPRGAVREAPSRCGGVFVCVRMREPIACAITR